ncbi:MAG TPA: glutamine--fructose-6-phosphate transaminase (isomerizing) [Sulfurovum sp.]|jgi:glucosamine--fructose-6-phosphate aminotransferase (isomerizing)|nr:MAG: glutamine--fructose-6-phosphate transaminase (isomerizing) [Sulfurovum sp. 35-42-20]OYZ25890.1 MAG: glutamine--fructose-6-phosphate transaminase (isomerizing) [Sulfurovum sp. 16-42-52]OYZ48735.1 MAG: glutamine--fructose-6-phosphate transaminase (isomerizing) [Sulfurovum sp. 24-42-9]OZA46779.1 MAG: glutamine--fructose-6-phosphate transaminase (isomerizing) [Sulfurovum sp. 17-42-90]OZA60810.1 MAG: glutamine--fructose-6-phosphate transaminase (isomerizing) [Sulfurovum sp. 39-42-12]HQR7450
MCGIVGYLGLNEKKEILLDGLQELEYRGYDSAGIAVIEGKKLHNFKAIGKLENLREKTKTYHSEGFGISIGHTRWATHGKPTELNAHPHLGAYSYVVHNGIIENYQELKHELQADGVTFLSQTDTETIVHLFEKNHKTTPDAFLAFEKTIQRLEGAYATLLITEAAPDTIFFAKQGSPMLIGFSKEDVYFASSDTPIIGKADEVYYLEDGEYGYAKAGEVKLFNAGGEKSFTKQALTSDKISAQKDGYRFFMEKEIYEQSRVMSETMIGRVRDESIYFEELGEDFFDGITSIKICACGTSYHSALCAAYLFERLAKVRCDVEIASEFRYKEPLLLKDTLFVTISQSGETADTLEALKMAKRAGLKSLSICNVDNSSIVRQSDAAILTRAGIEKGVASTKAFATQTMVLWMLAVYLGQTRKTLSSVLAKTEIDAMLHTPKALIVGDELHAKLHRLSKRYLHGHGFFFIGRDIFYPLALEGALKLKEISYLHAEGYPAGEMKHGPIALADSELFTVALMPRTMHYDKIKSNVEELSARDATILAISPEPFALADDFIQTQYATHPMLEFFEMMVVTQLFALEISVRLGNDVDMPRNLAKSVTVE